MFRPGPVDSMSSTKQTDQNTCGFGNYCELGVVYKSNVLAGNDLNEGTSTTVISCQKAEVFDPMVSFIPYHTQPYFNFQLFQRLYQFNGVRIDDDNSFTTDLCASPCQHPSICSRFDQFDDIVKIK